MNTYNDSFFKKNGVVTEVKPQILNGLEYQRAIHDEELTNLAIAHPMGAHLGWILLQRVCAFVEFMITDLDKVWYEYVERGGDIQPAEAFLMVCAVMRQIFREFRKVRQHGAAVAQWVCTLCSFVL
jgi:hypothetical protein